MNYLGVSVNDFIKAVEIMEAEDREFRKYISTYIVKRVSEGERAARAYDMDKDFSEKRTQALIEKVMQIALFLENMAEHFKDVAKKTEVTGINLEAHAKALAMSSRNLVERYNNIHKALKTRAEE